MSVRFLRPANPLKQALKATGGLKMADALAGAQANLAELAAPARAALEDTLSEAERLFAAHGATYDEAAADTFYDLINRAIGLADLYGHPALDQAVVSLCDLLDRLKTRKVWDAEAVGVHVHSLRLLLGADPQDAQIDRILGGLRKVSAKYA